MPDARDRLRVDLLKWAVAQALAECMPAANNRRAPVAPPLAAAARCPAVPDNHWQSVVALLVPGLVHSIESVVLQVVPLIEFR